MKRILFVTPYYPPDLGPSAPLISMLCERLASQHQRVSVIAAVPHYPSGIVPPFYRGKAWQRSVEHGVEVWRVWVPTGRRDNLVHRMLVFVVYQILAVLVGLQVQYDAAVVTNPAIETGIPFAVLCWLRRKPSIYCVWDLYPEIGTELGLFRDALTTQVVKAAEDFCLRHASAIQALAASFLPHLARRMGPASNLVHIPLWTDVDDLRPSPRRNRFAREHGLENAFVVLYAGNLGYSQNLPAILETARMLNREKRVRFVLVGDGPLKAKLRQEAGRLGLHNVTFLPLQPRDRLSEVLSTADLAWVGLQKGAAGDSIPSKTLPLMACGRPILACVEEGSELRDLVQQARAGLCVDPQDAACMAQAVMSLKRRPQLRAEFGRNGQTFVRRHHSAAAATARFNDLLANITQPAAH